MKIFLVSPPLEWEGRRVRPRHPPVLLASTAAALRADGMIVGAVDAYQEHRSPSEIAEMATAFAPDMIMLLPHDVARETPESSSVAVARALDLRLPGSPVILIGTRSAGWCRTVLDQSPVAAAFIGEPEAAARSAAGILASGADWSEAPATLARGGQDQPNPVLVEDLDELPDPAWDLLPLTEYSVLPHRARARLNYPLFASRGCPWNACRFCQDLSCVKTGNVRRRSPERVVNEMVNARKLYNATHFLFHDANFPTEKDWLQQLVAAAQPHRDWLGWTGMTRADGMDRRTAELLAAAGCRNLCFGVETGDPDLLADMNKGQDLDTIRRAVAVARAAGMEISTTFVFGYPGETPARAMRTIRFAIELNPDYAQFLIVKWHELPRDLLQAGTLERDWDMSQFDYRGMVFVPRGYSRLSHLKFMRSLAFLRFYGRPSVLGRALGRALSSPEEARRYLGGAATIMNAILNR